MRFEDVIERAFQALQTKHKGKDPLRIKEGQDENRDG